MTVIFDTGSDWLVLDSDLCNNCIEPVFNTSNSTTFIMNSSSSIVSLTYGSATADGYNSTDQAFVVLPTNSSNGTGLTSFQFLALVDETGIDNNYDGILGLSR